MRYLFLIYLFNLKDDISLYWLPSNHYTFVFLLEKLKVFYLNTFNQQLYLIIRKEWVNKIIAKYNITDYKIITL